MTRSKGKRQLDARGKPPVSGELEPLRVIARQRVLRSLATAVEQFLVDYVLADSDRRLARKELLELLLDAADIGVGERIREHGPATDDDDDETGR